MRLGLLSGTFDPVHAGHIELARLARDRLDLDQVWLLPERQPRGKKKVTPYHHRLAMLEAAAKDDFIRIVEVSGNSHSIATLAEISGGQEIYILTGADVDVSTWDSIDEIRSLANIVSFGRNGLGADIELSHQASSKTIRERITSGKKPNNLDAGVLEYIYEHKLYQS